MRLMKTQTELPDVLRLTLCAPRYRIGESAHLAELPAQTLVRWFNGALTPVGERPMGKAVSYLQLLEAAFVGAFRSFGAPLPRVRKARDALAVAMGTEFPFAHANFGTDGLRVAKESRWETCGLSGLVVKGVDGEDAWPSPVADRIAQCDYDAERGLATRWRFRGRGVPLTINPGVSGGMPAVEGSGVATWALAGRFRRGESRESLLDDFPSVTAEGLEAALEFEGALQAAA